MTRQSFAEVSSSSPSSAATAPASADTAPEGLGQHLQRSLSQQAELARRDEENEALRQGALLLQEDLQRCDAALERYQAENRAMRAELGTAIEELQSQRGLAQQNHSGQCVVCMANEATHVSVPCGHLCLCEGCCEEL